MKSSVNKKDLSSLAKVRISPQYSLQYLHSIINENWGILNMTKVVDPYDIEYIAYHMDNDKNLLELLAENIDSLSNKNLSGKYTDSEIVNELEHVTPHLQALCDVLL